MTNILYIWDADYPWDVRVEKICETLKNDGYTVHIASRNLKKNPEMDIINEIIVHRLKKKENDRLNYLLSFPFFFNPIWKKFIYDIIEQNKIEIIIVRDLPMVIAGIWAGRKYSIPVIFDMAEDYVSMLRDIWKVKKYKGLNLIVRNPYLAKFVEKYAFKNSAHILVVVEEAIDVVTKNGGEIEKITIVSNTPNLEAFIEKKEEKEKLVYLMKDFTLIYTGGIQMGRGIQTVIRAIPKINHLIPNFRFVVVGDGYAKSLLQEMAKNEGVDEYIEWMGWVSHEEIFDYIKASKIGIIPHLVTDHVNTTIPNKIFDYMGCGKAVICSDAQPLKRLVKSENCGTVYKSGDPDSLADAVCELYKNYSEYGEKGMQAVNNKYNWKEDEKRLKSVINKLKKH